MIRFLILCTIFSLLYLAFSVLTVFDTDMIVSVFGYQLETRLFTFVAFFIIAQLVLMIILKLIFLILDIPSIIKRRLRQNKLIAVNKKLLRIFSELLMGNRKESLSLASSIIDEVDQDNKEVINLVMAEAQESFDKKIQYFRNLIDKKNYSVYASKRLAEIFYKNTHHLQAEECAVKAFNEDDTDTELMLILIRIYANLGQWSKLVFIVSKLKRADVKKIEDNAQELARYYYIGAKFYLQNGDDDQAMKFLEYALELNPVYLDAITLLIELLTNKNDKASVLKILKSAFSAAPSFEIARMYADNATESAEAIYSALASVVQSSQYQAVFLALAAYLGLNEKFSALRDHKLLMYKNTEA